MNALNIKEQSDRTINIKRERMSQSVISYYRISIITITFIVSARTTSLLKIIIEYFTLSFQLIYKTALVTMNLKK